MRNPSGPMSFKLAVLPVAEKAKGDMETHRFSFLGVREKEKALVVRCAATRGEMDGEE